MAQFFSCDTVSEAWYVATSFLLAQPGLRSTHLVLEVKSPLREVQGVRDLVDQLFANNGAVSSNVERVADTIFPQDFYVAGEEGAMEKLFERRAAAREFEAESVPKGNYFDHLCAYPYSGQPFNQLQHVVRRLTGNRKSGMGNSNQCEVGVSGVIPDLRVQTPGVHKSIMGFPCLSHISVTLAGASVNLAATYRAQDFTCKGYGNLLGLGRLTDFLAKESGFGVGEVLCIATGAILEKPPRGLAKLREVVEAVGKIINRSK